MNLYDLNSSVVKVLVLRVGILFFKLFCFRVPEGRGILDGSNTSPAQARKQIVEMLGYMEGRQDMPISKLLGKVMSGISQVRREI